MASTTSSRRLRESGVLPRGQVDDFGVELHVFILARRDFAVDEHEDQQIHENQSEEDIFVHRLDHEVEGRHEVAERDQERAAEQRPLRGGRRNPLRHDADQHHRQQRDEVDAVHPLQITENAVDLVEQRGDSDRYDRDQEAEPLAGTDHLGIGRLRADVFAVEAEAEQRAGGVQGGVEARQDRADHHGGEETGQHRRQHVAHQRTVGQR